MPFTEVPLMAVMIEPFSIPAFLGGAAVDYFRYIDAGRHVIHFRKIRAYIRLAADPDITCSSADTLVRVSWFIS